MEDGAAIGTKSDVPESPLLKHRARDNVSKTLHQLQHNYGIGFWQCAARGSLGACEEDKEVGVRKQSVTSFGSFGTRTHQSSPGEW